MNKFPFKSFEVFKKNKDKVFLDNYKNLILKVSILVENLHLNFMTLGFRDKTTFRSGLNSL